MIRIAERKSPLGLVTIFQAKRTGSMIYSQGGFYQSEADGQGVSLASYIHAIYGLLVQAKSQKILMIGCGGGTLATMLFRKGCDVTVVDVDPQAFLLARKYFGLPNGVTCRVADGSEFLLSAKCVYDAIILDAFAGDRIPIQFQAAVFFRLARTRLRRRGCMLVNVITKSDLDNVSDRLASGMAEYWTNVRILDRPGSRNRNTIVMAGAVSAFSKPALHVRPEVSTEEIDADLQALQFRARRPQKRVIRLGPQCR